MLIGLILLGIVLSALFQYYRQTVKTNITVTKIKQTIQQVEIFNHRIRSLLIPSEHSKVWLQTHSDALGPALMIDFEQGIDKDRNFSGKMQGMLFLTAHKLSFVTWGKNDQARLEVLLDNISSIEYELFDAKSAKWNREWPEKKEESPVMLRITLDSEKKKIPFVYFLDSPTDPIVLSKEVPAELSPNLTGQHP